jgi:predicted  nucleic acid-binding Zn-ribbon protein
MTKALLAACIAISLGAAVLGFLNRGKLADTRTELENKSAQLTTEQQKVEAANKDIESKKTEIAGLNSEKEKLNADLGEAKANLDKAQGELTAANEKATALTEESASKDTKISELETKVAEMETQLAGGATAAPAAEGGADLAAMQTEMDEAKALLTAAQDRNTGLEAQITELKRKEDSRQKSQMRQGVQGTILAVNQAWNFVVLSIGDRQGVVSNAEMLVQRGTQLLGKVRVTSVEPSTSIADIVVRTVPRGFSVMPGDTVIYPAQAN